MFVKPAPGLLVRDPVSLRFLPPEGKEVKPSTYWVRRVACGDVLVVSQSLIPDSVSLSEPKEQ